MAISQVNAVIAATHLILGTEFKPGVDVKSYITKDQKDAVIDEVTRMLVEGEAELSADARAKFGDKLRGKYVAGMVTNHFNRCKALNGGTKYEAKNPGSRVGQGDEELKTMKALRANFAASGKDTTVIDAAIAKRVEAIKSSVGVRLREVDVSKLPEDLRAELEACGAL